MKTEHIEKVLSEIDGSTIDRALKERYAKMGKRSQASSESKSPVFSKRMVVIAAAAVLLICSLALIIPLSLRNTDPVDVPSSPDFTDSQPVAGNTSKPDMVTSQYGNDSEVGETKTNDHKPEMTDCSLLSLLRRDDFDLLVWSNDDADLPYSQLGNLNMTEWNGINVTDALLNELDDAKDDDMFAIVIKSTLKSVEFSDYVYEGKTGAEIYKNLSNLYFTTELYREMTEFSEAGEEGIAKFLEFVVPDFEKVYGEGFADKYYKNGRFDVNLINEDRQNEENRLAEAEKEYKNADERFRIEVYPNAYYLEKCGGKVYNGYHESTDQHYTIVVLTKSALSNVQKLENHKWLDFDYCCFSLVKLSEEDIAYESRVPDDLTEEDDLDEIPEAEMP